MRVTLTLKALRALGLSLWPLGTLSSEHPRDQLACLRHRAISPRRGISIAQRTDRGGHRRAGAVGRATTPEPVTSTAVVACAPKNA